MAPTKKAPLIPTSPDPDPAPDGRDADGTALWVVGAVIFGLAGIGGPILALIAFWLLRQYI